MKIAALGSGNGGCAVAFDCSQHGHTQGDFYFYEEGFTPAVGRLLEAIDRERIALENALTSLLL